MQKPRGQAPRLAVGFRCHSCSITRQIVKDRIRPEAGATRKEPRKPRRKISCNQLILATGLESRIVGTSLWLSKGVLKISKLF